jgi:hypothetical protein
VEAVTANVREVTTGLPWCAVIGLRFVSFRDGARRPRRWGVAHVFAHFGPPAGSGKGSSLAAISQIIGGYGNRIISRRKTERRPVAIENAIGEFICYALGPQEEAI